MSNYICVDKTSGRKTDIKITDNVDASKLECERGNGITVREDDWIDPSSKYVCIDKTGNKYWSKQLCDHKQIMDPTTVMYRQIFDDPPLKPLHDRYVNKPEDKRKKSRATIMIVLYLLLLTLYTPYLLFISNSVSENRVVLFIQRGIYKILFGIFAIGMLIHLICPFGICYLEPDSFYGRRNPLSFLYDGFCSLNKLAGITPKGCT